MATHFSVLVWKILGGLQSMGLQIVGHDRLMHTHTHIHTHVNFNVLNKITHGQRRSAK